MRAQEIEELNRTVLEAEGKYIATIENSAGTESFADAQSLDELMHELSHYFIIENFNHNPNFGINGDSLFLVLFSITSRINIYSA